MLREKTVFGPIRSRRLGNSLGINLLPTSGKLCNFDCIYCECGFNADGRTDEKLPDASVVRSDLETKLASLLKSGEKIDSITFAGDGEPTLHPDFPQIVRDTVALRDAFFPAAAVSVLSNATRLDSPGVFEALRLTDNPIMKIDAPTNALAAAINRPYPGYDVEKVVESLRRFEGDFILQTMFLRSPSFDSSAPEVLGPWMDIVRYLHPRKVMAYTLDRPAPMEGLLKIDAASMRELLKPLLDEGFDIDIRG